MQWLRMSFAALFFAVRDASPASVQAHVRLGVDRLADSLPRTPIGKRVGLITNHTGCDRAGTPTIDLLAARKDMKLVALFGPEHGIRGVATGSVGDDGDEKTGLPVYSLFGETQKPTAAMLGKVDALVFDVQDVGVRQYTLCASLISCTECMDTRGSRPLFFSRRRSRARICPRPRHRCLFA